jgi:hypothetical protein
MTKERKERLEKAEKQMEELVFIRRQLRVLEVNSTDAGAAGDIRRAIEFLMSAGKKTMISS